VLAMLWLANAFRTDKIKPGEEPAPRGVVGGNVVAVQRVMRPQVAEVVGSVQAENRTTVAARLVANIVEMRVRAGDRVKKGDVLVVLDDRDLRARVAQAHESLTAAEARRDLTKIELDRVNEMFNKNVASSYELDQWRTNHVTAVSDVAKAQQAVAEAEVALSDAQIKCPIDGIVIDRQAEPGDQASPGRPLLTVYDPSRLRLEASVREAYVGRLKLGQPIEVWVDAVQGLRKGQVQEIVPAADPSSRSFAVKVHLNEPAGLYPGMFGKLILPLEEREDLVIPRQAVIRVGQLALVDVDGAGGAERRAVRLGAAEGDQVVVLAGLAQGEQVIVPTAR